MTTPTLFPAARTVLAAAALSLLASCSLLVGPDDTLSIPRAPYNGSLRTDGYWWHEYGVTTRYLYTYTLYQNGVIHSTTFPLNEREAREGQWRTEEYRRAVEDAKYLWGAFEVVGDTIRLERWYPPSGGGAPFHAYVESGVVLDDTTFVITEVYRMDDGEKTAARARRDTFRFRQLAGKPDSTNRFVR
jgi:hypothetical protein